VDRFWFSGLPAASISVAPCRGFGVERSGHSALRAPCSLQYPLQLQLLPAPSAQRPGSTTTTNHYPLLHPAPATQQLPRSCQELLLLLLLPRRRSRGSSRHLGSRQSAIGPWWSVTCNQQLPAETETARRPSPFVRRLELTAFGAPFLLLPRPRPAAGTRPRPRHGHGPRATARKFRKTH
jgi:hypothetical protein